MSVKEVNPLGAPRAVETVVLKLSELSKVVPTLESVESDAESRAGASRQGRGGLGKTSASRWTNWGGEIA